LEMIRELGYCSGIENYSRYFDGRKAGARPFCLLDYFPRDFLMIIDESHVSLPQVRAMYNGDRLRKTNLVDYGFRLPSALDNRPLKFEEFEGMLNQVVFVSATPSDYELQATEGLVAEQVIRPTGIIDPTIEIRPTVKQVDDLLEEIQRRTEKDERVLVTTLTKRMAEELTKYMAKVGVRCRYIHSEVDTLERVEILRDLRLGLFDVLVGVNLLREGLDLPEVSLVAILDADKEGFLRNQRSLIQTIGRAARNVNGTVIMYADRVTDSMQRAIDETERRREKQIKYNIDNHIVPQQAVSDKDKIMRQTIVGSGNKEKTKGRAEYLTPEEISMAAEEPTRYNTKDDVQKSIDRIRKAMEKAAKELDFIAAAKLRDEMFELKKLLDEWGN
jgi:excinuclease ABC subunit B